MELKAKTGFIANIYEPHELMIKQEPYVGDDGIFMPAVKYVQKGCTPEYRLVMTKEMFVEAYNKWIKEVK